MQGLALHIYKHDLYLKMIFLEYLYHSYIKANSIFTYIYSCCTCAEYLIHIQHQFLHTKRTSRDSTKYIARRIKTFVPLIATSLDGIMKEYIITGLSLWDKLEHKYYNGDYPSTNRWFPRKLVSQTLCIYEYILIASYLCLYTDVQFSC